MRLMKLFRERFNFNLKVDPCPIGWKSIFYFGESKRILSDFLRGNQPKNPESNEPDIANQKSRLTLVDRLLMEKSALLTYVINPCVIMVLYSMAKELILFKGSLFGKLT